MQVLVVGGAGYIGAHMCKMLAEHGHGVVVLDDLSTGHRPAVRWGSLVESSLADPQALDALFNEHRIDAVMHFAAASLVGESMVEPLKYYRNNVAHTINLLEAMRRHGVRRFVFSSTAAVYGEPLQVQITEDHPQRPVNPYGQSKRMIETMLQDCARAHDFTVVSLRYFNAAGADASGLIGESHSPETHLIPRLLKYAHGEDIRFRIFGDDYATQDGTCVRDYIHVNDLADAHLRALMQMDLLGAYNVFNLGNGNGHSVREVVQAAETVIGRKLAVETGDRRPGDPAVLVASSQRAQDVLGWQPQHADIHTIIESAWRWHLAPVY